MTSLTSLIERIEAATEGSRELDIAICQATDTNGYRIEHDGTILVSGDMGEGPGWFNIGYEAPPYSTSIDSALTLLPEGLEFEFTNLYGVAAVGMGLNTESPCYARREDGNITLALLAAILRARQAMQMEASS